MDDTRTCIDCYRDFVYRTPIQIRCSSCLQKRINDWVKKLQWLDSKIKNFNQSVLDDNQWVKNGMTKVLSNN